MAVDIIKLYDQVANSNLLSDSVVLLVLGIRDLLDTHTAAEVGAALHELVRHPDDQNRQVSAAVLLAEALTRGTSHVAVDPRHPGYAMTHKLLTEEPELDRAKEIQDLRASVTAKTRELEAKHAELEAVVATKADEKAGQVR